MNYDHTRWDLAAGAMLGALGVNAANQEWRGVAVFGVLFAVFFLLAAIDIIRSKP